MTDAAELRRACRIDTSIMGNGWAAVTVTHLPTGIQVGALDTTPDRAEADAVSRLSAALGELAGSWSPPPIPREVYQAAREASHPWQERGDQIACAVEATWVRAWRAAYNRFVLGTDMRPATTGNEWIVMEDRHGRTLPP